MEPSWHRVGRCLDWLYPDELHRAVARDREVEQLDRLLQRPDNRPVALVGPRLVGKTTVLHECVRRRVARRGKPYAARHNVWLLSPQRLISGMMYVGQWEGRVQAILREARSRRHVLYFDDFLGLYHAGISRDASLSVADVLKPFILPPRGARAGRDDAGSLAGAAGARPRPGRSVPRAADRADERGGNAPRDAARCTGSSKPSTAACSISTRCRRSCSCIKATFAMRPFPANRLPSRGNSPSKHAGRPIGREQVQPSSTRKPACRWPCSTTARSSIAMTVVRSLQSKLVGQDEAVQAAADVVAVAKARLADPGAAAGDAAVPRPDRRRQDAVRQGPGRGDVPAMPPGCCAST